jgi:hypothetical protein
MQTTKDDRQQHAKERHEKLMQRADGVGAEVLTQHAPVFNDLAPYVVCEGCDMEGFECERPEWPCSTYQLVGKYYGATFSGDMWALMMELPEEQA